jgi:hypothetical protein
MIETSKGRDVPAAADDAGAKAAREKFEGLLKELPGPRPEQQLREKAAATDVGSSE